MPVMTGEELLAAQRLVRRVPVGESVVEAILALVRAGRRDTSDLPQIREHVAWGPGPARQPGADAGGAARAPCSTGGWPRRSTTWWRWPARAAAPHGAQLRRARRWRHHGGRHRAPVRAVRLSGADPHAPAECDGARLPTQSACGPAAAAAGRSRAGRLDRGARRAWPPARRPGRCLLAVPPLRARRRAAAHRLAAIGQVDRGLHPRDGVGGGADRLAVARRLALHALSLRRGACAKSASAPNSCSWRWLIFCCAAGERVRADGRRDCARPPRWALPSGWRSPSCASPIRPAASRRAASCRAQPDRSVRRFPVAGRGDRGGLAHSRRAGHQGPPIAGAGPGRGSLPFAGRVRFAGLEGEGELIFPRVETVRDAYVERFLAHEAALKDLARGHRLEHQHPSHRSARRTGAAGAVDDAGGARRVRVGDSRC